MDAILCILLASQLKTTQQFQIQELHGHRYAIYSPADDRSLKKPLLLWLHGNWYPSKKINLMWISLLFEKGNPDYYIVVPEHVMDNSDWSTLDGAIIAILDEVEKKHPIDKSREYVFGISSGGTEAWHLAAKYPGRFAAVVPTAAGGADTADAAAIAKTPVWAFHAPDDEWVSIDFDRTFVGAVKEAGGIVELAEVQPQPGTNSSHDAWTTAIRDYHAIDWMLKQRLGQEPVPPPHTTDWTFPLLLILPWIALFLIWRFYA